MSNNKRFKKNPVCSKKQFIFLSASRRKQHEREDRFQTSISCFCLCSVKSHIQVKYSQVFTDFFFLSKYYIINNFPAWHKTKFWEWYFGQSQMFGKNWHVITTQKYFQTKCVPRTTLNVILLYSKSKTFFCYIIMFLHFQHRFHFASRERWFEREAIFEGRHFPCDVILSNKGCFVRLLSFTFWSSKSLKVCVFSLQEKRVDC